MSNELLPCPDGLSCSGDAIDVEALKRETYIFSKRLKLSEGLPRYSVSEVEIKNYKNEGYNEAIDHLASAGYIRAPLTKIEGLSDAIWVLEDPTDERNEYINKVLIAAKAYLKASEV